MKCEICNNEVNGLKGLSIHLTKKHNNFNLKDYYDKYIKKNNEGKCYFCKNEAIFKGLTKGYDKICESKVCLGKTRATGTYEFLMYKYDLCKEDAIKMMNERANERGKKIKKSLDVELSKNINFHKEKSHQTKEYWLKRGFSEAESIKKAEEVMNMIHEKTWTKRREQPELYKDILPAQLGYWLKKGYSKEESKEKQKENQRTFTLEKCIIKYGEFEGVKKWNKRQQEWLD